MTKKFDFIGKRKLFLCISAGIILAGLIANIFLGTELDINFKGGAIFTYSMTGEVNEKDVTAIATEHLGKDVDVSFSKDVAGDSTQITFTLVKVPSTVLTYSVSGPTTAETVKKTAEKTFGCETKVDYTADKNIVTVDPVDVVTEKKVTELTNALSALDEKVTYSLTSSNTVNELADAMLADMVAKFGTKLTYTAKADKFDAEAATTAVEDAAMIDLTVTADKGTVTVTPAAASTELTAEQTKTITKALQDSQKNADVKLKTESYNAITLVTSNSVKATVGKGFFIKCLFAVVLGGIFLTLYIGIRFRRIGGLSAGLFATFALIHDVLIAYLVYVIFRIPLDDNFIAVVLTILGYSINGTIVVYDRIRENERKLGNSLNVEEIVNRSVNETVTRNIYTSLSTFFAVVAIAVVAKINGLDSIISFAFPIAVGIISGFYSSVLLSSPMWAWWRTRKLSKESKGKK